MIASIKWDEILKQAKKMGHEVYSVSLRQVSKVLWHA
jgi:hypothetical protein